MSEPFQLTPERAERLKTALTRYPVKRAAMLPALWLVQEQEGWISPEAMAYVARVLEVTPGDVYEVVTFYTMFPLKPIGRHHIQVCTNFCCNLVGAESLLAHLKKRLGVNVGETTPDGKFHLSTVECLASCGTGPMMQVNNDYYENLTPEKVEQILERLRKGESRGL